MHKRLLIGAACIAATLLVGCGEGGLSRGGGFALDYANARTALEEGDYPRAIRLYKRLAAQSGPFEPRMRIELAHALLRDDNYEAAALEARTVAATSGGDARAAALAVAATAEHRIGQVAMTNGTFGPAELTILRAAKSAFDEVLSTAPELDPLGGLAERRQMIGEALAYYNG